MSNSTRTLPDASHQVPVPVIQRLSRLLTPLLLRTPLTPNQITVLSLALGLSAAWQFAQGSYLGNFLGAFMFALSYVLDNCDGEVARARQVSSTFGHRFNTFSDWLVNASFFVGLGMGASSATGEIWWLWVGCIAGLGATINSVLQQVLDYRQGNWTKAAPQPEVAFTPLPDRVGQRVIFFFRELARGLLVTGDLGRVARCRLVPGSAGCRRGQAYWLMSFAQERRYHV